MDTLTYTLIIVFVIGIIITFVLLRKKTKEPLPEPLDLTEPANWSIEELNFMVDWNIHRKHNGLTIINDDDIIKILTQGRVKMWIKNEVPKENLHDGFAFHAKPYYNKGYTKLDENVQAGYTGDSIMEKYQLSSSHNRSLLQPGAKSGAITIRKNHLGKNRTCLIVTK